MIDLLFDGACCQQTVDGHVTRLSDAPGSFARLQIVRRVPIRIEYNYLLFKFEKLRFNSILFYFILF